SAGSPLPQECGLAVPARREKQHYPSLCLIQKLGQPRPLDDVPQTLDLPRTDVLCHPACRATPARSCRLVRALPLTIVNASARRVRWGPAPGARVRRARVPSAPRAGRGRREPTGEGVLTGERLERRRDLASPRHAELVAQYVAVGLHGSRGDAELP